MKRIAVSISVGLFVGAWLVLVAWASGADLSVRGSVLGTLVGFATFAAVAVAAMVYDHPGWKE